MIRKSLLPKEYQQVEYIENTGSQYINTGLIGKSGYTLETELSFTQLATGSYQYFAGYSYTGSADRLYYIRMANNSRALGYTYGSDNSQTSNFATLIEDTWYKFKSVMKANLQQLYLDGTLLGGTTFGELSYDSQNPKYIYMFVTNYVNSLNGPTKAKCKYAKWYDENDELVRWFIPCYRISDNVIGMYDLITKSFYDNQGTGVFGKGNNTVPQKVVKIYKSALPSAYQEVDYIRSGGTQYIDTGVPLNNNSSFELDFQATSTSAKMLFGARYDYKTRTYTFNIATSPNNFVSGYVNGNIDTGISANTNRHVMYRNKEKLYFDGTLVDTATNTGTQNTLNAYIFACNQNGTTYLPSSMKFYGLKIWQGNTLVRNFIPCYRKSDEEIGVYDLVNKVFYTNAGTSTFAKGNNVSNANEVKKVYKGQNIVFDNVN